jgi:hypothetical protein
VTDIQLLTIVLTLLAIYGATFWTRKGVEDMRDVLRAESKAQFVELRAEMKEGFLRVENKLDHLADTIASHSARLDKLEG